MQHQKTLFIVGLCCGATLVFGQTNGPVGGEPHSELIKAVTTNPWPVEIYPTLPSLSSQIQRNVLVELASPAIRGAYEKMDAKGRNNDWFAGIEALEKEKAVWSLLSCVCHPHDDVQIRALRGLERLHDTRAVPFLLTYADYMAVRESGSENATLHGIIQAATAKTLSVLTGIEVVVVGQDPQKLKQGIKLWQKWLAENEVSDSASNFPARPVNKDKTDR